VACFVVFVKCGVILRLRNKRKAGDRFGGASRRVTCRAGPGGGGTWDDEDTTGDMIRIIVIHKRELCIFGRSLNPVQLEKALLTQPPRIISQLPSVSAWSLTSPFPKSSMRFGIKWADVFRMADY
jgi:hypothetical protein